MCAKGCYIQLFITIRARVIGSGLFLTIKIFDVIPIFKKHKIQQNNNKKKKQYFQTNKKPKDPKKKSASKPNWEWWLLWILNCLLAAARRIVQKSESMNKIITKGAKPTEKKWADNKQGGDFKDGGFYFLTNEKKSSFELKEGKWITLYGWAMECRDGFWFDVVRV